MMWNPWHGCKKLSEGCKNCYVYRRDSSIGKDASAVTLTKSIDLPLRKDRTGKYKFPSGSHLFCCMTSDFFIEDADEWRKRAWEIMSMRSDMSFTIITKRIDRFYDCIPPDWGSGYKNVAICCTTENQRRFDERFPILCEIPAAKKLINCEPLLSPINMKGLDGEIISKVIVGGESGRNARTCDYDWVLDIREQCISAHVPFYFKQTGAAFIKDGRLYRIARKDQLSQARRAKIDYKP